MCVFGTPGAKRPSPNTSRRPRAPRSRQRADIIRGVDRCRTPPVRMSYTPRTAAYAAERWSVAVRWPDGAAVSGRRIEPRPGRVSDSLRSLQRERASAGNRTRGESMATIHFATKPLMPCQAPRCDRAASGAAMRSKHSAPELHPRARGGRGGCEPPRSRAPLETQGFEPWTFCNIAVRAASRLATVRGEECHQRGSNA